MWRLWRKLTIGMFGIMLVAVPLLCSEITEVLAAEALKKIRIASKGGGEA